MSNTTGINEIKDAVVSRLIVDTTLIDLLGGEKIYYRRPVKKVNVPVITYYFIARVPDWATDEYGKIDITMQLDVWSTSEDLADKILYEVDRLLYQYRVTTTTWDIKRFLRRGDRTLPKDEEGIAQLSADWLITAYKRNG